MSHTFTHLISFFLVAEFHFVTWKPSIGIDKIVKNREIFSYFTSTLLIFLNN